VVHLTCRRSWAIGASAFAAMSPGKILNSGQNATRPPPCMRWRGPCCGLAAPDRPVIRPPGAARRPPAPGPVRCTGFPAHSHVSGVAPRWCPLPTVKAFLQASASVAQGSAAVHFKFFPYPHDVHRKRSFIRTAHQLSTVLCTSHPQVTGRNPAKTRMPEPYVRFWFLPGHFG
jgi:hypothetical protein